MTLEPPEVTRLHGLPTTTPKRTLEDLAATTGPGEMERLIAEAEANHLVERGAVKPRRGRRGASAIRQATVEGPRWTRSHAERVLLKLVRDARLPLPEFNVAVAGCQVDAVWFEHRVALEVDSWAFHGHRRAFERDRDRDIRLREAGFTPVRVTARQLEQETVKVAAHLARLTS
jgi:very-short-patch-repair endonuclease